MAHRTRAHLTALAATLVMAASCTRQGTQLLVLVDSDYAVPRAFSQLDVRITNPANAAVTQHSFSLVAAGIDGGPARYALPLSFGVVPPIGNDTPRIVIEFAVLDADGNVQSTRTVSTGFISNESLLLPVFLPRACHGQMCTPPLTCGDQATCVTPVIDPSSLTPVTDPNQPTTFDVPPASDRTVTPDVPIVQDVREVSLDAFDAPAEVGIDATDAMDATDAVEAASDATDAIDTANLDANDAVDVPPCDGANLSIDPANCGTCGVTCAPGQICSSAMCALPQTCAEIAASMPGVVDGPQTLYAAHMPAQPWDGYCANMATAPAEYVQLANVGVGFNFSQYTAGGSSPGSNVRTNFTRLHIDGATLVVDGRDLLFSTSTGSLVHSGHAGEVVMHLGYGSAIDCIGGGSLMGVGNIDLRGTHFSVMPNSFAYPPGGVSSVGVATYGASNQVVDLQGGGFCGWMSPGGGFYTDFTAGTPDPLQLVYFP